MAALTADRLYKTKGPTTIIDEKCAGNDTYYQGAFLVYDTDGYLNVPSDAAGLLPAGVYTGRQGKSLAVASGSHTTLEVEKGLVFCPFTSAVQSDAGERFYLADDGTVTQTAGSKTVGILCVKVEVGVGVWLDLNDYIVG